MHMIEREASWIFQVILQGNFFQCSVRRFLSVLRGGAFTTYMYVADQGASSLMPKAKAKTPSKKQRASTRSSRANAVVNVTAVTSDATDAPTPSTSTAEFDRVVYVVTDKLIDRLSQRISQLAPPTPPAASTCLACARSPDAAFNLPRFQPPFNVTHAVLGPRRWRTQPFHTCLRSGFRNDRGPPSNPRQTSVNPQTTRIRLRVSHIRVYKMGRDLHPRVLNQTLASVYLAIAYTQTRIPARNALVRTGPPMQSRCAVLLQQGSCPFRAPQNVPQPQPGSGKHMLIKWRLKLEPGRLKLGKFACWAKDKRSLDMSTFIIASSMLILLGE
ncbi:hypothetical protein CAPTEDRAFT_202616 [Capitella teleta]|uniref:Uncharacterized protein n=1 Tax=Capitella teleta TaxID=283909 RepID=R7V0N5_CAPTE|nr:hypothetical protein CAPTEDRAFT_202616 [Capitella teleta]|eukprot:ELU12403.1 hypothetical protein CAPTEDRAFT_202616 [Capitella teleta]